jgi:hypothetical protein
MTPHERTCGKTAPCRYDANDTVLFLAGEVYHDRSDLDRLAPNGHAFRRDNATSIVHLYEERGEDVFRTLNGWFNRIPRIGPSPRSSSSTTAMPSGGPADCQADGFSALASEAKSLRKASPVNACVPRPRRGGGGTPEAVSRTDSSPGRGVQ